MRAPTLLIVLVLAGCAAPPPGTTTGPSTVATPPPFTGEPLVQDHDHNDPALHNGSANIHLVARVIPWGNGTTFGEGSVNEFAVRGDLVYVSRSNPEGGFAVVNLADPTNPKVIGDYHSEGGADIEVTADGKV